MAATMRFMSKDQAFVPLPNADESCALCTAQGGILAWSDAHWRVVRVEDADFPAYYRVIANYHTTEFTDLSSMQRQRCMTLVAGVERVLRDLLAPTKVNLAALGNQVPHLHWHVIARFDWDSHFPQPIWGTRQREVIPLAATRLPLALPALDEAVAKAMQVVS
jgi:diadenosine tetraphosphate (Ap4A) HIT family hydrolase